MTKMTADERVVDPGLFGMPGRELVRNSQVRRAAAVADDVADEQRERPPAQAPGRATRWLET